MREFWLHFLELIEAIVPSCRWVNRDKLCKTMRKSAEIVWVYIPLHRDVQSEHKQCHIFFAFRLVYTYFRFSGRNNATQCKWLTVTRSAKLLLKCSFDSLKMHTIKTKVAGSRAEIFLSPSQTISRCSAISLSFFSLFKTFKFHVMILQTEKTFPQSRAALRLYSEAWAEHLRMPAASGPERPSGPPVAVQRHTEGPGVGAAGPPVGGLFLRQQCSERRRCVTHAASSGMTETLGLIHSTSEGGNTSVYQPTRRRLSLMTT